MYSVKMNYKNGPEYEFIEKSARNRFKNSNISFDWDEKYIFAIGGQDYNYKKRRCEKYCITSDTWEDLPNLNLARCSLSVSYFKTHSNKEYIYAMGGE
jgi:hypothetical protein